MYGAVGSASISNAVLGQSMDFPCDIESMAGPGIGNDVLNCQTCRILGGQLILRIKPGFQPQPGNECVIITCSKPAGLRVDRPFQLKSDPTCPLPPGIDYSCVYDTSAGLVIVKFSSVGT